MGFNQQFITMEMDVNIISFVTVTGCEWDLSWINPLNCRYPMVDVNGIYIYMDAIYIYPVYR